MLTIGIVENNMPKLKLTMHKTIHRLFRWNYYELI